MGNATLRRLYGAALRPLGAYVGLSEGALAGLGSDAAALARGGCVVAAPPAAAECPPPAQPQQQPAPSLERLAGAVSAAVRAAAAAKSGSVLALGSDQWRNGVNQSYPNTSTNALLSEAWAELHAAMGDAALAHVLAHTALFVRLPNANFMQLAGAAATERGMKVMKEAARLRRGGRPCEAEGSGGGSQVETGGAGVPGGALALGRPSETLCPRQYLYCASFGRAPGLPANHLLLRVRRGPGAGRRLYTSVFLEPPRVELAEWRGGADRPPPPGMVASGAHLPKLPKRVPRQHRGAPAALAALAEGAATCPYARLLRANCPLPACLRRGNRSGPAEAEPSASTGAAAGATLPTQEPPAADAILATQLLDDCAMPHTTGAGEAMGETDALPTQLDAVTAELNALANSQTSSRAVAGFVWGCLLRMAGPAGLLGPRGSTTRAALKARVQWFVCLRRFEKCSVHQLCQGVRASELPFGQAAGETHAHARGMPVQQAAARQRIVERWVLWLFACIVSPLIRAHFYATEAEATKQTIVFYRKPVWARLAVLAERQLTLNGWLEPLAVGRAAAAAALRDRQLGYADLRLLPRARDKGVRPLLNLGASHALPAPSGAGHALSLDAVNAKLRPAFHVLKYETLRGGAQAGSSVFNPRELHARLRAFLAANARRPDAPAGTATAILPPEQRPRLYVVAADISRAFDTVDRAKLLEAVEAALCEGDYLEVRFASVKPHTGASVRCAWANESAPVANYPQFADLATRMAATKLWHAVLTDQVRYTINERAVVRSMVREHISDGVVCVGGARFYRHAAGIAQGSKLSSLLCSLHYGAMERAAGVPGLDASWARAHGAAPFAATQTSGAERGSAAGGAGAAASGDADSMLVRMIDDFLFLSVDYDMACAFLSIAAARFPAFGAQLNISKTRLNFSARVSAAPAPAGAEATGGPASGAKERVAPHVVRDGLGAHFVPWCGFLLQSEGLQVRADYARLSVGGLLGAVNASTERVPGRQLLAKMPTWMRERLKGILLDSTINTRATVCLNIYQAALLVALKARVYLMTLRRSGAAVRAQLVQQLAASAARFAHAVAGRERRARRDRFGGGGGWAPSATETERLVLAAFARAFCGNRPPGADADAAGAALQRVLAAARKRPCRDTGGAALRFQFATRSERSDALERVLMALPDGRDVLARR